MSAQTAEQLGAVPITPIVREGPLRWTTDYRFEKLPVLCVKAVARQRSIQLHVRDHLAEDCAPVPSEVGDCFSSVGLLLLPSPGAAVPAAAAMHGGSQVVSCMGPNYAIVGKVKAEHGA